MATIGVIGAGTMGSGIAQAAAQSGYSVKVFDSIPEVLKRCEQTLAKLSAKAVEKGKQSADERQAMLSRIQYVETIQELRDCFLVIEAVVEIFDVKKAVFKELDGILSDDAIIASNTSSMSITSLAAITNRPERVAGMHFFNPAQVMKLVEIIRGLNTSDHTVSTLKEVVEKLGKVSIEVKRDTPGFVVNRLLVPQLREAMKILEEGVASVEDIDKAMKLGLNHPMGPFALSDLTGLDVVCFILDYFRNEMGDQYCPPLILKQMVEGGRLGRKSGQGWYHYE